jgi:hypothetical protein
MMAMQLRLNPPRKGRLQMTTFDKPEEFGFGVAKKPDTDNPNAPKLKGWIKATKDMKAGNFYNFTLWTSRKEVGSYNIKIEESKKHSEQSENPAEGLDDEIPF